MEPEVFGWQHLVFLGISIAILVVSIVLIKKFAKTDKSVKIILKCAALVHLATIVASRVSMAVWLEDWMSLLPDSFCALSSVLLPLGMLFGLKKDSNYFHFIVYLAFIGGVATIAYPSFIDQDPSFFFGPTITGLLHHAMMVYNSALLFVCGYFTPTLKKWKCLPLGGACMMTYGIFLITALNEEDAMHIESPLIDDTPLTWYVVAVIAFAVSYIIMALFDYFLVYKKAQKQKKKEQEDTQNCDGQQADCEEQENSQEEQANEEPQVQDEQQPPLASDESEIASSAE